VFYPDTARFSGAARIPLQPGEQAEANLSLNLEPFQTVTATAIAGNGKQFGDGQADLDLSCPRSWMRPGHRLPYAAQFDAATHSVQAVSRTEIMSCLSWRRPRIQGPSSPQESTEAGISSGFADIAVAGHPVTGVRIPLSPVASWPIRVRTVHTDRPSLRAQARIRWDDHRDGFRGGRRAC